LKRRRHPRLDVGLLAAGQPANELEQGVVQTAAQVQGAEGRQGDDGDAMRGADVEGDRASVALQGQVVTTTARSQPLSSSSRLAASITPVVSAGGSTQAVDLEHRAPAHGAVGAREVFGKLLGDARCDVTGQTGAAMVPKTTSPCGRFSPASGRSSRTTVVATVCDCGR
jgi:hypothetical protein